MVEVALAGNVLGCGHALYLPRYEALISFETSGSVILLRPGQVDQLTVLRNSGTS